jgi:hypothetical protein
MNEEQRIYTVNDYKRFQKFLNAEKQNSSISTENNGIFGQVKSWLKNIFSSKPNVEEKKLAEINLQKTGYSSSDVVNNQSIPTTQISTIQNQATKQQIQNIQQPKTLYEKLNETNETNLPKLSNLYDNVLRGDNPATFIKDDIDFKTQLELFRQRLNRGPLSKTEPVEIEPSRSAEGFFKGFVSQIPGVGMITPEEQLYFKPQNGKELISYSIGHLLGFMAGIGILGKAFSVASNSIKALKIGQKLSSAAPELVKFSESAYKFLSKLEERTIKKASDYLMLKNPTISKFLFGKQGLENYLAETIKFGTQIGVLSQFTVPIDTNLKKRIEEVAKGYLYSLAYARLGLTSSLATSIVSHAAFGGINAYLSEDNYGNKTEEVAIQTAIWAALGAVGGLKPNADAMWKWSIDKAYSNVKKIPEVSQSVDIVRNYLKDLEKGRVSIPLFEEAKQVYEQSAKPASEIKLLSEVSGKVDSSLVKEVKPEVAQQQEVQSVDKKRFEEAKEHLSKIVNAVKEEQKRVLKSLNIDEYIKRLENDNKESVYDVLKNYDYRGDLSQEIESLFNNKYFSLQEALSEGIRPKSDSKFIEKEDYLTAYDFFGKSEESQIGSLRIAIESKIDEMMLNRFGTTIGLEYERTTQIKGTKERFNRLNYPVSKDVLSMIKYAVKIARNIDPKIEVSEKGINEIKTQKEALSVYKHLISLIQNRISTEIENGNTEWLKNARFKELVDTNRLRNIIERFKETDGSRQQLGKAILDEFGEKPIGFDYVNKANKLVKEIGFSSVEHLYTDIASRMPEVFDQIRKRDLERNIIEENFKENVLKKIEIPDYDKDFLGSKDIKESKKIDLDKLFGEKVKKENIVGTDEMFSKKDNITMPDIISKVKNGLDIFILKSGTGKHGLEKDVLGSSIGDYVAKIKKGLSEKSTITTIAHEALGHIVDTRFGITEYINKESKNNPLIKEIKNELLDNMPREAFLAYKPDELLKEAFAYYMEYKITNNSQDKYKLTDAFVKKFLDTKQEGLYDWIESIGVDYRSLANADALSSALAIAIKSGEANIQDNAWNLAKNEKELKSFKDNLSWAKEMYRNHINNQGYSLDIDRIFNLEGSKSINKRIRTLEPRIVGTTLDIFEKGIPANAFDYINFNLKGLDIRITRGLEQIWKDVPEPLKNHFTAYLWAKEYNYRMNLDIKKNGKITKSYPDAFNSIEKQMEIINKVEELFPNAPRLANEIADFWDKFANMYAATGLMKPEEFVKFKNDIYYSSLARYGGLWSNDFQFNSRFFDTMNKAYTGSSRSDIVHPIVASLSQIFSFSKQLLTRDIYLRLAQTAATGKNPYVTIDPEGSKYRPINIEPEEIINFIKKNELLSKSQIEELKKEISEKSDLINIIYRPFDTNSPNRVRVKSPTGEEIYLIINENLKDAIQASNKFSNFSFGFEALRKFTSIKRTLLTSLSPSFMVKNPIRDAIDAMFQSERMFIPVIDSIKGLSSYLNKDDYYRAASIFGLKNETLSGADIDSIRNKITKFDVDKNKFISKLNNAADILQEISNASEMMTRIGVLRKFDIYNPNELANGIYNAQEAAFYWRQRGRSDSPVSIWNQFNAFFKANIVAFDTEVRTIAKNPIRTLKRAYPLLVLSALHAYAMRDNDKYWEQPMWRLISGINIPYDDGRRYITIPVFGNAYFMLFYSLPQIIFHDLYRKDKSLAKDWITSFISNLIPNVQMTSSGELSLPTSLAGLLTPDIAKPFVEYWANKKLFNDSEILPSYIKNLPAYKQVTPNTSDAAILASKALINLGFPEDSEIVSPVAIEFFVRNSLFSIYDLISSPVNLLADYFGVSQNKFRKMAETTDIIALNQFLKESVDPASYSTYQKIIQKYNDYKRYQTLYTNLQRTGGDVKEFLNNHTKELELYHEINGYIKVLKEIVTMHRLIKMNERIPEEEKLAKMKDLEDKVILLSNEAYKHIKFLEKKKRK